MTTERPASRAASLPLVGGILSLDFANTASGRDTEGFRENLLQAADLVAWARHAAVLDEPAETRLQRRCGDEPWFGARLLGEALRLRDAIYRLDTALAQGCSPAQNDIDTIAATHAACLGRGRLTTQDGGFGWTWDVESAPDAALLGPIAASAMALITTADRARLKHCQGHHCGWLFLDTTKSNNRRWCEMEVCGNRAKQKRRRGRRDPRG